MADSFSTLKQYARVEIEEKKSVFIGHATPVVCEEEAVAFIAKIKKEFSDATHNVYAYTMKEGNLMRYSDDREPQGSAGLPILGVLAKGQIYNSVIVVTRYFGGTLLGTGGLVRAYTAAATAAVSDAGICNCSLYLYYSLVCTYSDYQRILPVLSSLPYNNPEFGGEIRCSFAVSKDNSTRILAKIRDLSGCRATVSFIKEEFLAF